jgi:hypothetical protein
MRWKMRETRAQSQRKKLRSTRFPFFHCPFLNLPNLPGSPQTVWQFFIDSSTEEEIPDFAG